MKIALIGRGKTGGKVLEIAKDHDVTTFSSENPITALKLRDFDVAICFIPGEAFLSIVPTLLEANIPLVSGCTGHDWPHHVSETLKKNNQTWVYGTNFSLGMRLINEMINTLSKTPNLFQNYKFDIHEIHHTKKLDAPSGTALSWKEWLNLEADVTSERIGDVVGDHKVTLTTPNEVITLNHQALDRKIFAEGALWTAEYLLKNNKLGPGLFKFEQLASDQLNDQGN